MDTKPKGGEHMNHKQLAVQTATDHLEQAWQVLDDYITQQLKVGDVSGTIADLADSVADLIRLVKTTPR